MSDKQPVVARKQGRREFLKSSGIVTAALLVPSAVAESAKALPALPLNPATPASMPTRNLGKTGYRVGIFSLGGQASLELPNNFDVAVPIIERALDLGVNYIDTSSRYGRPERWSEQYIGKVMAHRRNDAFLATKTRDRTRDGSLQSIETSLRLLQTDHLDLLQLHDIGSMTDDVDVIFGKGGAMEAYLEMQQQKVVHFLGVTGHFRPDVLMECLRRHPFDTILMAMNAADPHHFSFNNELLPMAVERQMGIIGMKIPARGKLLSSFTPFPPADPRNAGVDATAVATRPGTLNMREAMYYTLSRPVSTVIIGCDTIAQLEENVHLAREFTPLSESQSAELVKRAEPVSKQSLFFRFVTR
jgi:hypothetical protein